MNIPIKNTITLIFCFLSLLLNAQEQKPEVKKIQEWIVLKDGLTGYSNKKLTIPRSIPLFNYQEKVYGTLLIDSLKPIRSWVVEVKEGSNVIYFPFPELVQNIVLNKYDTYKIGEEPVNILYPLPVDYKPKDLVLVDQKWNYHEKDYPKYLRKEVNEALLKMLKTAHSENIHLKIVSAFRTFQKQRALYLRAISNKGIEQVGTAKPAHSEHQLGTTVDLTSEKREDLLNLSFDQTPEGKWLKKNARTFGFIQSYTKENSVTKGYMSEPWHYRYVGPN